MGCLAAAPTLGHFNTTGRTGTPPAGSGPGIGHLDKEPQRNASGLRLPGTARFEPVGPLALLNRCRRVSIFMERGWVITYINPKKSESLGKTSLLDTR